jgi:hypothetical protein
MIKHYKTMKIEKVQVIKYMIKYIIKYIIKYNELKNQNKHKPMMFNSIKL